MESKRENLNKIIYVNFHKTKLLSPTQGLFSEPLYVELPKNLVTCFKGTLASLLLDTTEALHGCLLLINF